MARFDILPLHGANLLVVDVQADILRDLRTRVVVPVIPIAMMADEAASRLRPRMELHGCAYILNTPEIASVPCSALGERIGSMAEQDTLIVDAIDFLIQGF